MNILYGRELVLWESVHWRVAHRAASESSLNHSDVSYIIMARRHVPHHMRSPRNSDDSNAIWHFFRRCHTFEDNARGHTTKRFLEEKLLGNPHIYSHCSITTDLVTYILVRRGAR